MSKKLILKSNKIIKADKEKKLVEAYGCISLEKKLEGGYKPIVDLHKHHIPQKELYPIAKSFIEAGGLVNLEHTDVVIGKCYCCYPEEYSDLEKGVNAYGESILKSGIKMITEMFSSYTVDAFDQGVLTGMSMEGLGEETTINLDELEAKYAG